MASERYSFRFKDPVTGKWVRARYRATRADIARRYTTAEIVGLPVAATGPSTGFNPYPKLTAEAQWLRSHEPSPELHPPLRDALECALVRTFLRRYVTYCARRGRYAAMNGAARLLGQVGRQAAG